jgi:hypothetical protein
LKKINLGFVITFNRNSWLGGNIYLSNLVNQIQKNSSDINILILTSHNCSRNNFLGFKKIKIIRSDFFSNKLASRILNKLQIILFGKDFLLENFLIKNKIDVLSHFFITGRNSKIKSLYWIPDFQEIYNLKYISFKRKLMRRFNLLYAIKNAFNIILSSNTVKNDLKKIDQIASNKAVVFKPFFETPNKLKNKKILIKYNIKKKFFLLPNQYWKHKNHFLILNILKEINLNQKQDIQIVSTGYFYDHRFPEYKNEILHYIDANKLNNNFRILGIVPYEDLMDLMHLAIAVINPSKSEGWSSTVEQAKSMGKMVLLSNLQVHKEQTPYRNFYFNLNNKKKLIKKIIQLHKDYNPINEKKKMFYAKQKMTDTKKKFALKYINYIRKIANE